MGSLATLFAPETVAVVGATDREGAVGRAVTRNLLDSFDGTVVAVNPNDDEVLGLACRDSLSELAGVDVAVVVVPPEAAIEVVHEALVPLEVRSYIILAGLLVWLFYAIYKLAGTEPASGSPEPAGTGPAD